MASFNDVELKVIEWAQARSIIPNSTPRAQLLKTVEELGELAGELAGGEARNDMARIKDGVGDVMVTLIIYCALRDINLVDCIYGAYDEIKHRKGTLRPDGVFVKESDGG